MFNTTLGIQSSQNSNMIVYESKKETPKNTPYFFTIIKKLQDEKQEEN